MVHDLIELRYLALIDCNNIGGPIINEFLKEPRYNLRTLVLRDNEDFEMGTIMKNIDVIFPNLIELEINGRLSSGKELQNCFSTWKELQN